MKNKAGYERILQTADELRLSIAEWAQNQKDADIEKLGSALQPLRYDMEELESGNYDASRMLLPEAPAVPSNSVIRLHPVQLFAEQVKGG